eukprot:g4333.t1
MVGMVYADEVYVKIEGPWYQPILNHIPADNHVPEVVLLVLGGLVAYQWYDFIKKQREQGNDFTLGHGIETVTVDCNSCYGSEHNCYSVTCESPTCSYCKSSYQTTNGILRKAFKVKRGTSVTGTPLGPVTCHHYEAIVHWKMTDYDSSKYNKHSDRSGKRLPFNRQ